MNPWQVAAFGMGLVLLGATYQRETVQALDAHLFAVLHQRFSRLPWIGFFRVLWLLGITPTTLAVLVLFAAIDWRLGLSAAAAFGLAALVERAIKVTLRRPRPFASQPGAFMLQPTPPKDPSFPSGDAMRVWFLASVLILAFQPAAPLAAAYLLLALLTSLGRIAMGVHYPLDVLAGSGLGLAAAGLWLVLYQVALTL